MTDDERNAYLERVDAFFRRLIDRTAPVRWGVADTPAAREAVWRLRAEAVLERGWATPDDLPSGMERDDDDDRAVHIVGWNGEALAATGRLVFPLPGAQLPTEKHFNVAAEPHGCVVNLDRMVVARSHSTREHHLLKALLGQCWLETRARGFHILLGVLTPAMIRLYQRIGWQVTILGPPRLFWGEERMPVRFDPYTGLPGAVDSAALPAAGGPHGR